ncbi:unnamed protein product [Prunus armeniaca]|uniref:Protein-S-isoprenylcysteine O-methyltransferase n=1 Tax=Prunus armeniaca TaxID=36596 RepID=A0A6J5TSI8_PRUAR|nr:unnamed protein product [Prunus armeniaca]
MSFLKHVWGDAERQFWASISHSGLTFPVIPLRSHYSTPEPKINPLFCNKHGSSLQLHSLQTAVTDEHWWVSNWGLGLLIIGEIIRKMAIITAGRSFTHLIRVHHSEHHQLITNGIYRVVRHPGYCGFFIWSVGTQIMLLRGICQTSSCRGAFYKVKIRGILWEGLNSSCPTHLASARS